MKPLFLAAALLLASAAQAEQQLPVYPGAVHTRIGNDLVIGGEYYRLAYFTTKDQPEQVVAYFRETWEKLGYPVTITRSGDESVTVSALYTREGLLRSVVVRRHQGQTVGFTALKDLWVTAPARNDPALLQMEGMIFSQDTSARDETGGSITRTQVIQAQLKAARDEAVQKLEAQGFKLDRETASRENGREQRVVEFLRGHDQASVALTDVGDGTVAVHETLVTSSRPDGLPTDAVKRTDKNKKKPKKEGT